MRRSRPHRQPCIGDLAYDPKSLPILKDGEVALSSYAQRSGDFAIHYVHLVSRVGELLWEEDAGSTSGGAIPSGGPRARERCRARAEKLGLKLVKTVYPQLLPTAQELAQETLAAKRRERAMDREVDRDLAELDRIQRSFGRRS